MQRPALRALTPYAIAFGAVGLTSLVIAAVLAIIPIGNLSTLYLIPVLLVATRLGRTPAIASAVTSFLVFDWFFVQPIHTLRIADPGEWVSLVVFLITAVVTGELAASERARAQIAVRREREAVLLYDAVRLMADPDLDAALRAVAERVRAEMRVSAAAIDVNVAGEPHLASAGAIERGRVTELLGGGRAPTSDASGQPGRWIRVVRPEVAGSEAQRSRHRFEVPVRVGGRTVGHISLLPEHTGETFSEHQRRLLELISTQLGALVGRAELREATTRAEILRRTDELKSALLNAVSHDLRTPLASIIASTGSLRQGDVTWTPAEQAEFVDAIEQQAQRLSRIVGNLLDLSRIEAGALHPQKQLYDVSSLIDDVVDRLRETTKHHHLRVEVEEDLPPVALDEVQIDQVLSNLIENATKYAPQGTEIEVGARRSGDELIVDVSDRGPGLPPEELDRVFVAFHRVAEGRGGLGLGLAVARGLVEAHGGGISAANRPGGGSRFAFTLPIRTSKPAEREAVAR